MKRCHFFSTFLLSTTILCNNASAAPISSVTDLVNAILNGGSFELGSTINAGLTLGTITNDLTLDGKGFGITGIASPLGMTIALGADVTLKNIGTVGGAAWSGMKYNLINAGNLTLDNIYFNANVFSDATTINGGILRNEGISTLNNVTMTNNSVTSVNSVQWGGLIMNGKFNIIAPAITMSITNSRFADNTFLAGSSLTNVGAPHGGVLLNQSTINLIDNVTFENNSMTSQPNNTGGAHGTAIDNNEGGYIGTISNSTFKNNKVSRTGYTTFPAGTNYHASAAALDNYGTIDKIVGTLFEGNSAETQSESASATSGAIMSLYTDETKPGRINLIEDTKFINNHTFAENGTAHSGATSLANTGIINEVLYQGNYAKSTSGTAYAGAAYYITLETLSNTDFINNHTESESGTAHSGAAYLNKLETLSNTNFIGNHAESESGTAYAGAIAIANVGSISDATFSKNFVLSQTGRAYGGAINFSSAAVAGDLTNVVFSENYAKIEGVGTNQAAGGAIYSSNTGTPTLGNFTNVSFKNNYAYSASTNALAGAMISGYQTGSFNGVTFDANYAESAGQHARAGALFVNRAMGNMQDSIFSNNYAKGETYTRGGALYVNTATTVGNLTDVTFEGNHADSATLYAQGGALYNLGTIGDITTSSFSGNYATSLATTGSFAVAGGAIYNAENAVIGNITADFDGNYVQSDATVANGGAIYNMNAHIGNISGNFTNNYAKDGSSGSSVASGAIMNDGGTIGNVSGVFSGNYAESINGAAIGGAIFNSKIVGEINADFSNNAVIGKTMAFAGAIANVIGGSISSISGNFTGNYAKGDTLAIAGAIYSASDLNFKSVGATYAFSGNYVEDAAGVKEYKAVFLDLSTGATKIDFDLSNGGKFVFDDQIYGGNFDLANSTISYDTQYDLNIKGGGNGLEAVRFNNEVINAGTVSVDGAVLEMGSNSDGTTHGNFVRNTGYSNLVLTDSMLNLNFSIYQDINLANFTADITSEIAFGANFGEGTSDSITAETATGSIILKAILLSGTLDEGNKVTLFKNATLDISNISNFNIIYKNYKYALSQDVGDIVVGEKGELNVPIHVEAADTLQIQDTDIIKDLNVLAVLNDGVLTIINSQIANNSNADDAGALKNVGNLSVSGGSFTNNSTELSGGAIYNTNEAGIQGTTFDGNSATLSGGAIYNTGELTLVDSTFNNNTTNLDGGAIYSNGSINMSGTTFNNNSSTVSGGAIFNAGIGELNGNKFTGNTATQNGGAIYNTNDLKLGGNIFENNTATQNGGAVYNDGTAEISGSTFTGNTATQNGGALYNDGEMIITNSSFSSNAATQNGGAIYTNKDLSIVADKYNSLFKNNTAAGVANDIYMVADTKLNLDVKNNGTISFDSGVNGGLGYDIYITGDNKGSVNLNSKVENVDIVSVKGTHLNLKSEENLNGANLALDNATLNIANKETAHLNLGSLSSIGSSSFINLDVNPTNNTADYLNINGALTGTTKLVLNVLSRDKPTDSIAFAHATSGGTDKSFDIYRVIGSSFKWYTSYDAAGKEWSLLTPEKELAAESLGYLALPSAIIEQNRSMLGSIKDKTASGRLLRRDDYTYEDGYKDHTMSNVWINPVFVTSTIEKPVEIDASITGFEAGFDVQTDIFNKLGVFASYRDGSYDLNGKGEDYYSSEKSTIDITSYNLGGYYRFDRRNWWVLATAYAGTQDLDIATNDGVKTDTSATQFGGGAEVGYTAILSDSLTLEPSLGIFYSQTDIDDVKDNFGKTASYDSLGYMEIEGGLKLEKSINFSRSQTKVYVKPSIVQSIVSGNTAKISGLSSQNTFEDQTMGRLELGGRFGITNSLSGYGFWNYTLGSSYDAMAVGAGITYNW